MKKALFIFILMLSLAALFACGECEHADSDKNAICDSCGVKLECAECADLNLDAKCDVCGDATPRVSRTEAELYEALGKAGYTRSLEDLRAELSGKLSGDKFWHIGDGAPEMTLGLPSDLYLSPQTLTVYERDYNGWRAVYVFSTGDEVSVEFNTGTDEVIETVTVKRGGTVILPRPDRLGFEFIGWYYSEGGIDTEHKETDAVTRNLSLSAKWRATYVTYEDFGAIGDGRTNDFEALYNAHVYANENRTTVRASDGATYYISDTRIGGKVCSIPIKTDTVWGSAKFYIDDSNINYLTDQDTAKSDIFEIKSSYSPKKITDSKTLIALGNTKTTTDKLAVMLGYDALLVIEDNTHKVFRRYGSSYSASVRSGHNQSDALLINPIGVISDLSPITYDYSKCSSATAYRIDTLPLTVSGGEFTTLACALDAKTENGSFGSYRRGIYVTRSNVTLEGIKHYVKGEVSIERQEEGIEGAAYRGFIYIQHAAGVNVKNSVITARRYYGSGSYDLSAHTVVDLTLDGVVQSNFFISEDGTASEVETEYSSLLYYWGITGTNFSKSIKVKSSVISRFDAHCGLYGGSIEGSRINLITIAGTGGFKISDTEFYSAGTQKSYNSLVNLRSDYGSTWNGKIEIENVTAHVKSANFYLLYHAYSNWDFGYTTHIPNLVISDLRVITPSGEADTGYEVKLITTHKSLDLEPNIHLPVTENTHPIRDAESFTEDTSSYENLNPVAPPAYVTVKSNSHGYVYTVPASALFSMTRFISGNSERVGTKVSFGDFIFKDIADYK